MDVETAISTLNGPQGDIFADYECNSSLRDDGEQVNPEWQKDFEEEPLKSVDLTELKLERTPEEVQKLL